jgi:DNA-binding transcriptional LysR family regulator
MKFNNIDLNKLKCFQAVAEKGSLLDGAKHLNLTTSAVYQSIKKLEEDLEQHLFFRSGKKYILTPEGRSLQELFQRFLWDISEFHSKSQSAGEGLVGEIRVGLPLNFSKSIFVPIMKEFRQLYPKVIFHLTVAETRRLIEQISAFELDFAVTDESIPTEFLSKIDKKEAFQEELVMVCSRSFYKANQSALTSLKTMKELPHFDYSKHLPLVQRWYKLHYKRQVKISEFHSIDNVETMLAALRAGLGIGVIPSDLLNSSLKEELHIIPTTNVLYNHLFLVQEANYINNTLMKRFLDFFTSSLTP